MPPKLKKKKSVAVKLKHEVPCLVCQNCPRSSSTTIECTENRPEFWDEFQGYTSTNGKSVDAICPKFKEV